MSQPFLEETRRYDRRITVPDRADDEEAFCLPMIVMDEESQSAYIYLAPVKTERTVCLSESVSVDLDAEGAIAGVELTGLFPAAITAFLKG
jgi:uncharacterized protein YuzE